MNREQNQLTRVKGSPIQQMILASIFIAIGYVLPFITGGAISGPIFLPLHIPVLLCGLICGYKYGLIVGFVTPILRSLLLAPPFAPPMFPIAITMAFELAAYGFVIGLVYKLLPKKIGYVYVSLVAAMLVGRLVWGAAASIFYRMAVGFDFSFSTFISGAFIISLPGILIQITFIPIFFYYLMRANILPDFDR